MDQADEELRATITHIWPFQAKKILDLLVPPKDQVNRGKLTVGKIYCCVMMIDSWKVARGQRNAGVPVSTGDTFASIVYNQ